MSIPTTIERDLGPHTAGMGDAERIGTAIKDVL